MGYDLHITRAEHWLDAEKSPIPFEEWLEFVEADPELRHDGFAETTVGDSVLRIDGEGIVAWTAYSGHNEEGNKAWFSHTSGRIAVKNPDDEILSKMKRIAERLQAHVFGDDGEEY